MNTENLNKRSEAQEQSELIRWANQCAELGIYPELKMLYAIPNGGSRNKLEAVNLKRQGVKAGVPDLCLAVPKGNYSGLYVEMKVKPNKTTPNQNIWLENLKHYGYATYICYSAAEAKKVIEDYIKQGDNTYYGKQRKSF